MGESSDLDDEIGRTDRALAAITADIEAAQTDVARHTTGVAELNSRPAGVQPAGAQLQAGDDLAHRPARKRHQQPEAAAGVPVRRAAAAGAAGPRDRQKTEKAAGCKAASESHQQTLAGMYREIADLDQDIERNEMDYAAIDAELRQNDERISAIRDRREKTHEQFRMLELEQTQRKLKREHVTRQLEDRYQIPFAELQAACPSRGGEAAEPPDPEALEAELARYRTKIARIGDVNLGAIKEYQQLERTPRLPRGPEGRPREGDRGPAQGDPQDQHGLAGTLHADLPGHQREAGARSSRACSTAAPPSSC